MRTLIVTYDLKKLGQNYDGLIAAIKKNYPQSIHAMQSVFFLKTPQEPQAVYNVLTKFIDSNDTLFVGEISLWWANLPQPAVSLIKA